jgi:DNA-binding CsgD family transcriptional regulator
VQSTTRSKGASRKDQARDRRRGRESRGPYIAIIADIVRSRLIGAPVRQQLQRRVEAALTELNRRFSTALAAKFIVTVGDEFQGLLRAAPVIPQLVRHLEMALPEIDLRFGIGRGDLETDLREYAIGMDGPVWHAARGAIESAKASRRLGGVFAGFDHGDDLLLNGLARVLHHMRSRLTPKQRRILEDLLSDGSQKDLARRAGVSPQAISKQARAAGWNTYREGEAAWRALLSRSSPEQATR